MVTPICLMLLDRLYITELLAIWMKGSDVRLKEPYMLLPSTRTSNSS